MANTGFKGVDVLQTANKLIFKCLLTDINTNLVTSGTTSLYLYEVQDDGTLNSYDFNNNTFTTGTLTTPTTNMTHRKGNNSTTNTGIWSYALTTVTGFTIGGIYIAEITNSTSVPLWQARQFQYGSLEGDDGAFQTFTVGSSSSTTVINTNRAEANNFWNTQCIAFVSGACVGISAKVSSYANTNGAFTLVETLPTAPSSGDKGIIIGVH